MPSSCALPLLVQQSVTVPVRREYQDKDLAAKEIPLVGSDQGLPFGQNRTPVEGISDERRTAKQVSQGVLIVLTLRCLTVRRSMLLSINRLGVDWPLMVLW